MSSIANILAIVGDANGGHDSLLLAFRAARQFNAHVDAFHVLPDPAAALPLVSEAMSGAMVDEMMTMAKQESEHRAAKARQAYDQLVAEMKVPRDDGPPRAAGGFAASWVEDTGVEEQVVALRACRADLITLSRPAAGNDAGALMTLNSALMQSGRPVLVAPPLQGGALPTGPFARVSVFWNGSAEATRAITAALPFLIAAEQVIVLQVEEDEWYAPTEDLMVFLTRHGVVNVVSKVLPKEGRTGHSLLAATAAAGADMMVMGAYTRSKLRQLIFGSVTGYIMEHATLPVLLCH
ncbi:MAG: universal stress protein [Rhodospirillaceae bacterium]|nr:MAG: universal stress protein [Rhodospirillaceae bacterium]